MLLLAAVVELQTLHPQSIPRTELQVERTTGNDPLGRGHVFQCLVLFASAAPWSVHILESPQRPTSSLTAVVEY